MKNLSRPAFIRLGSAAGAAVAVGGAPAAGIARRGGLSDADVSRLYDAAKKEGTLTWWTAHYAQDAAERVRDSFKAKYPGVDVQFIRQTAQVVYQRLTQDLKAGIHQVDVFASTDEAHYPVLKKQGALAEFVPADIDKLPQRFRQLDPDNQYQLGTLAFVLINYNNKKIPNPPKKWTDLLDPKYKAQITTGHPGFSGFVGNWVVAMNDKYGWDYFTKLAANQPKIGRSIYDTVTDIIAGERTLGAGPDSLSLEKKAGRQCYRGVLSRGRYDPHHFADRGHEGRPAPQRRALVHELFLFKAIFGGDGQDVQLPAACRRRLGKRHPARSTALLSEQGRAAGDRHPRGRSKVA